MVRVYMYKTTLWCGYFTILYSHIRYDTGGFVHNPLYLHRTDRSAPYRLLFMLPAYTAYEYKNFSNVMWCVLVHRSDVIQSRDLVHACSGGARIWPYGAWTKKRLVHKKIISPRPLVGWRRMRPPHWIS